MNHIELLQDVIPGFNQKWYEYELYDEESFHYNHNMNQKFIDGELDKIEIVVDRCDPDPENWGYQVIFKYQDKFYRLEYEDGSHGYQYKIRWNTLKEVFPKTKEVVYYE